MFFEMKGMALKHFILLFLQTFKGHSNSASHKIYMLLQ